MGGGQAGAPADDDHVSWTRPPPGVATVTAGGLGAGLPVRPGRPNLRDRNGLTPGSGPRGQWEGSGSERLEAAEGLRNLQPRVRDSSPLTKRTSKVKQGTSERTSARITTKGRGNHA